MNAFGQSSGPREQYKFNFEFSSKVVKVGHRSPSVWYFQYPKNKASEAREFFEYIKKKLASEGPSKNQLVELAGSNKVLEFAKKSLIQMEIKELDDKGVLITSDRLGELEWFIDTELNSFSESSRVNMWHDKKWGRGKARDFLNQTREMLMNFNRELFDLWFDAFKEHFNLGQMENEIKENFYFIIGKSLEKEGKEEKIQHTIKLLAKIISLKDIEILESNEDQQTWRESIEGDFEGYKYEILVTHSKDKASLNLAISILARGR